MSRTNERQEKKTASLRRRLRCLTVDEDQQVHGALRDVIAEDGELEVAGAAADLEAAFLLAECHTPDLIFLDAQLASNGTLDQLLASVPGHTPAVVLLAALGHGTVARDPRVLARLAKPVDAKQFHQVMATAKVRIAADRTWRAAQQLEQLLVEKTAPSNIVTRIPLKSKGKIVFVRAEDIEWIEASGNYLHLHMGGETHRLRETMNAFAARLDPVRFMRIHRSTIVNVEKIEQIQPWFTGEYVVRMTSGKELTLSRSYRENLRRLLGEYEGRGA